MRLYITHTLNYYYSDAVTLTPHYIYLTPRISPYQELISHELTIIPDSGLRVKNVDAESNIQHIAYFNEPCRELRFTSEIVIDSLPFNPFDFVYFPFEAQKLPFAYPEREKLLLKPYLSDEGITTLIHQTAREIAARSNWETGAFLQAICKDIRTGSVYERRPEGRPFNPDDTLIHKRGSCRDFAVLMIALCKSVGIASRFVSGYCFGSERHSHDLHAWVEVYLPGGGWRGFDPTDGHAVNQNYVALAASAQPEQITPVTGTYKAVGAVTSSLDAEVFIKESD